MIQNDTLNPITISIMNNFILFDEYVCNKIVKYIII